MGNDDSEHVEVSAEGLSAPSRRVASGYPPRVDDACW